MKRLLCLLLTLLMLFGMTSCAGKKENDPLKTILSGMTLRDKAAGGKASQGEHYGTERRDP